MRRVVLSFVLASLLGLGCASEPDRPNVLILMWDTVRADRCSVYGHAAETTPNLARLASEAVVFDNAISPGIRTVPSHASLFTGFPVSVHGLESGFTQLDDSYETLAESFLGAGYATFAATANVHLSDDTNLVQGFQTVFNSWRPPLAERSHEHLRSKLIPGDLEGQTWLQPRKADGSPGPKQCKEAAPVLNETLLRWLDERPRERPYFAFMNFMETHAPLVPSESARRRFMDDAAFERSLSMDRSFQTQYLYCVGEHEFSAEELEINAQLYDAALFELDESLGDLVAELERRGELEDTILVVLSDHGESLGEKHILGHRYAIHEPLVRVPLLIRYPAKLAAARIAHNVSTVDLHATLLELAKIPGPQTASRVLPLRGDAEFEETLVVAEAPESSQQASQGIDATGYLRDLTAAYAGDLKLLRGEGTPDRLYDLREDPTESEDLAPADPEALGLLASELEQWLGLMGALRDAHAQDPEAANFSPETLERLRSLGYVDGNSQE